MKLTRLLSPIFILCMIVLSCKQESLTDDGVKDNYDQHIAIASDFLSQQQYDSSFYYFEKANRAASSKEQKVYALFQMAEIQRIFLTFQGLKPLRLKLIKIVTVLNIFLIYTTPWALFTKSCTIMMKR